MTHGRRPTQNHLRASPSVSVRFFPTVTAPQAPNTDRGRQAIILARIGKIVSFVHGCRRIHFLTNYYKFAIILGSDIRLNILEHFGRNPVHPTKSTCQVDVVSEASCDRRMSRTDWSSA